MSDTLTYKDSITRTGRTEIDGEIVMNHICRISTDDPDKITVASTKVNERLYRANLEACRADATEFEDLAYELQDQIRESKEDGA